MLILGRMRARHLFIKNLFRTSSALFWCAACWLCVSWAARWWFSIAWSISFTTDQWTGGGTECGFRYIFKWDFLPFFPFSQWVLASIALLQLASLMFVSGAGSWSASQRISDLDDDAWFWWLVIFWTTVMLVLNVGFVIVRQRPRDF